VADGRSPAPARVVIVGHGNVARVHADAIGALHDAVLVGVVGRDLTRARNFALEYGIEVASDVDNAMSLLAPDVVIVATPHPTHADIAVAATRAGAHVLVEKPLATSVADCDRILEAAASSGVLVGVVAQRRLLPPVLRMKAAIERGRIGKPILSSISLLGWRSADYYDSDAWRGTWQGEGGGLLVNQAVHHLDLLQWLAGPFEEVFGYWANLNHPDIEVDDSAVAVLRGGDGRLASITASNSQNPGLHARILVHGESGATLGVQTDGGSMFVAGSSPMLEAPYNHLWTIPADQELLVGWEREDRAEFSARDPIQRYHELVLRDFIEASRSGRQPLVPGVEGRACVELFEAIYLSTKERSPIRLGHQ